jgi:prepilin-type N-terminal cleavage/methylation domain-containing protein
MDSRQNARSRPGRRAFTLVECMVATAVCAIIFLATISLLGFARLSNEVEQERARAHQIVCERIEVERYKLFTWTAANSVQTIWDNGTPSNPADDIKGTLEVIIRDAKTGAVLAMVPNPAVLVSIEATLTWNPPGSISGRTLRESAMGLKSP